MLKDAQVGGARFSYDALESDGKRKSVGRRTPREDFYTRDTKRRGLQANAGDLYRNLSIFGWMVRRHLDYVARFKFYSRTGNEDLDARLQELMKRDSVPSRLDVARKFGREKMFRLAELRRTLDGDTYLMKLARMRLQGIRGDLVRNPPDQNADDTWIDGHRINEAGATSAVAIYKRSKAYSGEGFSRVVPASNVFHYGYFDNYANDQTRGVSPVVAALNPLRDVYENFSFALAKAKIGQLFALAIYQEGQDSALPLGPAPNDDAPDDQDGDHVEDVESRGFEAFVKSDLRFLDLEPHEKAEIIESKTPAQELQTFTVQVMQCGLTALDIPYSFFDSSHSNFFGSRAAWNQYERSTLDKRDDQIELRRQFTLWKYRGWIIDGSLELPTGWTIFDLPFEWTAQGVPWWKPVEEVKGATMAIAGGLDNPQRVCMSTGTEFRENVDKIAEAQNYAESKGVSISWDGSSPPENPAPTSSEQTEDDDGSSSVTVDETGNLWLT